MKSPTYPILYSVIGVEPLLERQRDLVREFGPGLFSNLPQNILFHLLIDLVPEVNCRYCQKLNKITWLPNVYVHLVGNVLHVRHARSCTQVPTKLCFGEESGWIRIRIAAWIRIQHINNAPFMQIFQDFHLILKHDIIHKFSVKQNTQLPVTSYFVANQIFIYIF